MTRRDRKGRPESEIDLLRAVFLLPVSPAAKLCGCYFASIVDPGRSASSTIVDVSTATGLPTDRVADALREFVDEGAIVRIGSRRVAARPRRDDRGVGRAGGRRIAPRGAGGAE